MSQDGLNDSWRCLRDLWKTERGVSFCNVKTTMRLFTLLSDVSQCALDFRDRLSLAGAALGEFCLGQECLVYKCVWGTCCLKGTSVAQEAR